MQSSTQQLSPEQYELYLSIVNEYEKYRSLSDDEKYDLIQRIVSTRYIDLLCDWAFKHVFGHNEENLMLLLNDILPEKIVHIEYESNEIDLFKGDDKQVIMDVLCHTADGTSFICEMQKSRSSQFKNRMFYYGASMAHRQLKEGDGYAKLRPVYVICFMNFRIRHETDQLIYRYRLHENGSHELYGDQMTIILCELPRLVKEADTPRTPVESWFEILSNMRTFAERPQVIDKRYEPIFKACQKTTLGEVELKQYFRAMITEDEKKDIAEANYEAGLEQGIEQGIEIGREEMRIERDKELTERLRALGVKEEVIQAALAAAEK